MMGVESVVIPAINDSTHVLEQLREELKAATDDSPAAEMIVDGGTRSIPLSPAHVAAVVHLLSRLAQGDVAVTGTSAEMTTSEVADYLNVSRPHVVKLIDSGKLPGYLAGTHRRVKFSDVLAFDAQRTATRRAALAELARLAMEEEEGEPDWNSKAAGDDDRGDVSAPC